MVQEQRRLGMETEYSGWASRRRGLAGSWRGYGKKIRAGNVTAKEMVQGLGRLGFATISLN